MGPDVGALPDDFTVDQPGRDDFSVAQPPNAPASALPTGFALDPGHPTAGRTDNFWTDVPRIVGTAATDDLGALLGLPRAVAQGVDFVARHTPWVGGNLGADAALGSIPTPGQPGVPLFPDPATARQMAYQTTGATEYQPATPLGRMGQAAVSAIPMGAPRLGAMLTAAAAGASAQGAAELGAPPPVRLLAGAAGGAGAAGLMGGASRAASLLTSAPTNPTYQAFQRLGLPTNLAGDATGNPTMRFMQQFAANAPGGEDVIAGARSDLMSAWQGALDRTAAQLGGATTRQEAGQSLQQSANDWLSGFKGATNQAWGNFFQLVPPGTATPVSNFRSALQSVTSRYGGANALAQTMESPLARDLRGALAQDTGGGPLPWSTVQALRSDLGEMLNGAQPMGGIDQATIKQLYGALSDDMLGGAITAGYPAITAYARANALTAAGHDVLENYVRPILNADGPERAADWAMAQARSGGTRIAALNAQLPGAGPGDLASAAVQQLAGADSPTAFASGVLGSGAKRPAYSPEAQAALFGTQAPAIQDLATAGRSMADTERAGNTSKTAYTAERAPLARLVATIEAAKAGNELGGVPGALAAGAGAMFMPSIVGRAAAGLATSPLVARMYAGTPPIAFQSPAMRTLVPLSFGVPGPGSSGAP